VSAMTDLPKNSKRLLYAAGYMIDSGSVVSVIPPGPTDQKSPDHKLLNLHMAQKWMNFISWDVDASIV